MPSIALNVNNMIYIVPFDFCNLASICRYFDFSNKEYQFLNKNVSIDVGSDVIVVPGVGSFSEGMSFLAKFQLIDKIRNHASNGGRLIGICLGMQLMFNKSEESPGVNGLGLLSGDVKKLSNTKEIVPRVGWDNINVAKECISYSKFEASFDHNAKIHFPADLYFVHSYYCVPEDKNVVSGLFKHGVNESCASVEKDFLYGFQFHPEKSGPAGYKILDAIFAL